MISIAKNRLKKRRITAGGDFHSAPKISATFYNESTLLSSVFSIFKVSSYVGGELGGVFDEKPVRNGHKPYGFLAFAA